MKKRSLSLLLMLALGAAGAQTSPAVASADARLSKSSVTFKIVRDGGNLSALLTAVAKSAGYELVLDPALDSMTTAGTAAGSAEAGTPAVNASTTMLTYDFAGKPFNQVWPFLMDVYGLNYEVVRLGSQDVLRVGRSPIQKIIALPRSLDAALVEERIKLAFGTRKSTALSTTSGQAPVVSEIVLDSPTLKIVGEPTSSSLIVRGTNKEVREVEALVTQIVASQPPELVKVVVAPSPVVQQIYTVKGEQADAEALVKAQFPGITVTAVGKTGKLVLSGQKTLIDTALALLGQVDKPAQLTASPDSKQQVYAVQGNQKDIATLLSAQFPGLKITPVGTTGQLVLNGAADQIDEALALLEQVDQPIDVASGPDIQQRVFQLVNASAEELKAVLDNTLQTELTAKPATTLLPNVPVNAVDANGNATTVTAPNPALQSQGTADSAASGAQAKAPTSVATIIADKRTNTLIVRGTAVQVEQVASLIPSLDQVVPQINVQVRIQEITEDTARTLGLDWKVGFGGFNLSSGAAGLSGSFDPTRALVGGLNILPTLNAVESQTQTKRIYDGSITMQSGQRSLLNATAGSNNASSGAAASVKSGGRLELNIPSSSGNIVKQIDYGINLDFYNPQVSPDGSITLRVRGQVSQPKSVITGTTLPNLLDFSNSEAQSVITIKSGQTLLLSGLLGTNQTSGSTGIPYLSSLPVIGPAFGQQKKSKTDTQLLVVITGNVIK
jgi:type IV pilus assembly protein PilQ